jgi:uncharacterized protein
MKVAWFEIPVDDIKRAQNFYGETFQVRFQDFGDNYFMMGPAAGGDFCGAIYKRTKAAPAGEYPMVVFGSADMEKDLGTIVRMGGKVVLPKTKISGDMGFFCQFNDCEGNLLSLWSQN